MSVQRKEIKVILKSKLKKHLDSPECSDLLRYEVDEIKGRIDTILEVFDNDIILKNVLGSDDFSSCSEWLHQDRTSLGKNLKIIVFNRGGLITALRTYIENEWMWCDELDWFLIDALLYAEIIATINECSKMVLGGKNHGYDKFMIYQNDFSNFKIPVFDPPISVATWVFVTFFSVSGLFWNGFFYGILGIFCAQFVKRNAYKKITKIIDQMLNVYSSVEKRKFSWLLLWELLLDSKKNGIVWDIEVYRLAEIRKEKLNYGGV